ncbi:MAG TPA: hypothetical protein VIY29_15595 [Ktedonobacteraceae bacterium]
MKIKLLFFLLLLFILPFILWGVYSNISRASRIEPDKLHLVKSIMVYSNNAPPTRKIVTDKIITTQSVVEKLYEKIQSLPPANSPINYMCVTGLPSYQLTFSQQGHTVLEVESGYCFRLIFDKNNKDQHEADEALFTLLKQAEAAYK